ncbi:MAG: DUF502 domain-containing protein [Planctomycetes bacterium]|nr:DUF502 domain-containing protein [Planctomycetota bacterium]
MDDQTKLHVESFENAKKPRGPFKSALIKGLAILLPALITIAIFAWAWGVLRDYAVVVIIKSLDSIEFMEAPEELLVPERLLAEKKIPYDELDTSQELEQVWITPDNLVYRFAGKRPAKPISLTEANADTKNTESTKEREARLALENPRVVYLLPDTKYSILDLVSAELNQQRDYDYGTRSVLTYSFVEYLIAIFITIILIILLGILAKNYFGKQAVGLADRVFSRVPVFNLVYPYAKQVVDFFFSDQKQIEFDAVVAAEWPREGCWQLGFVTGAGMKTLTEGTNGITHTTVFIPMSPIPMTGFTVFVPKEQVLKVDITVEEACMIILSGGVLTPPAQVTKPNVELDAEFKKRVSAARDERKTMTARSTQMIARQEKGEADSESDAKQEN